MTDARKHADSSEFLEAFAHELRAAGVDVSRITTGVPILHPQIFSFSGLWQLGKGTTERQYRAEPNISALRRGRSPQCEQFYTVVIVALGLALRLGLVMQ